MSDVAIDYGIHDDTTWYLADARGKPAGPRLVGLCHMMASQQATLRSNTDKCIAVFQWGGDAKDALPGDHFPLEENLVGENVAKNTVETVHAKICKARIAPMPLTTGGGYLARQRAKEMGQAIEGILDENECDALEEEAIMDALTTDHGAGAIKLIECDDAIKLEWVPIEDVWHDEAEVRQRQPRCRYHVPRDGIDKFVALERWARDGDEYPGLVGTADDRRKAIIAAANKPSIWRTQRAYTVEAVSRVDVYEAWHLPSGDTEEVDEEYEEDGETKSRKVRRHDGRHTIAVEGENGTLIDEPWDGEGGFPIVMFVPRKRRRHVLGMSLMRDLIPSQREYEKLSKKVQNQNQKMGLAGFATLRGDEIDTREITSGTFAGGFFVETNTQAPTPMIIDPVPDGVYGYKESIARGMQEKNGVSTMSSSSQVPAGLQQASGKALQTFEEVEEVRLRPYHVERERLKIRLAWLIVSAARRIVERGGNLTASYKDKKGLKKIDWAKVLLDRGDFTLTVFPVSELSRQPAAKFAQLSEMMDRGAITVEQFKRLFNLPDLEAENELDVADTEVIDRALDIMVVEGRYISPEPFDDFEQLIQRAGKFYNLCRTQEVPEKRLKLLRDFMRDARSLADQAKAAAAPPAAPAPMMPPGPPGMVPPAGPLPGMPPMQGPAGAPPMPMAA